jgi:transposase
MARAPRIDTKRLDLSGFEAWLRAQLTGRALSAVVVVILQIVRALFEQNTQLRQRLLGGRKKPPSERLDAIERQVAFAFALPQNDVASGTKSRGDAPSNRGREKNKGSRGGNRGQRGVTRVSTSPETIHIPNPVPAHERYCRDCGCEMQTINAHLVSYFELVPARLVPHVRHDEIIACQHCDNIRTAKAPLGLGDGMTLGPTLVAEAFADKALDAMPIERIARRYQRQGMPIAASTLGRSVGVLLDELRPLADLISERMKQSHRIQFDSTGLRVLDSEAVTGVHRDTLWVMVGDARWVRFAALRTGDANAIEEFMRGADAESFQCDGTGTTNFVETKWKRCRPGCHAHARRKFTEAVRRGDLRAMEPIQIYKRLFAIEQEATRRGLSADARLELRLAESAHVLEELRVWVLANAPLVEPKSPLGVALTYLQRQWMRLSLFLIDGNIEVTNNRSERELRPWVLGQHAWLFAGDQDNAERWADGFSLMHSAIAHGLNARAYLHAVVRKLVARHPRQRLHELLPDAMLRSNPELADPLRTPSNAAASVSREANAA